MATHGRLCEYNSVEDWISYVERLDQYFLANDVTKDTKKRAIFLSVVGDKTYKLIPDLLAPNKPTDKSFQALVDILTSHLEPAPSVIVNSIAVSVKGKQQHSFSQN